jgi:ribosomal protein L21E
LRQAPGTGEHDRTETSEGGAMTRRELLQAEIDRRGLTVTRKGMAYSIKGHGVDLLVSDLLLVTVADLMPADRFTGRTTTRSADK